MLSVVVDVQKTFYPDDVIMPEIRQHDPVLKSFEGLQGKTGIVGGTFDPVHSGHIEIASRALEEFGLDRVVFVPAWRNPLKEQKASASDAERFEMLKLALEDSMGLYVSDLELNCPEPSYTYKTLEYMNEVTADKHQLYFIMGAENIVEFQKWTEPERILQAASIITASRHRITSEDLEPLLALYSEEDRKNFENHFIESVDVPVSATEIRELLPSDSRVFEYLPEKVGRFIVERSLYGTASARS